MPHAACRIEDDGHQPGMETEAEQAMTNVPEIGLENRLVAEKSAADRKTRIKQADRKTRIKQRKRESHRNNPVVVQIYKDAGAVS